MILFHEFTPGDIAIAVITIFVSLLHSAPMAPAQLVIVTIVLLSHWTSKCDAKVVGIKLVFIHTMYVFLYKVNVLFQILFHKKIEINF